MIVCYWRLGQTTLPTTCPVCDHSPIDKADCKPSKRLRTTIKVFLRTLEKKKESESIAPPMKETTKEPEAVLAAPATAEDEKADEAYEPFEPEVQESKPDTANPAGDEDLEVSLLPY
jgi:hypothetical protein